MELQGINSCISAGTTQFIIDALVTLQQCGGIVNDDKLWGFADGCVLSEEKAKFLDSFGVLKLSLQKAMAGLKRVEAVKDALYILACSCERKLEVLKTELRPTIISQGIRMLPDAVLVNIFELCMHEHLCMDEDDPDDFDAVPAELTLSQVCSRFRSLALSIPSLWVRVSSRMTKSSLSLYLERSKSAPLTVVISESGWSRRLLHFIQLVVPHASRWKSFEFEAITSGTIQDDFPAKLFKHFGNLQLPNLNSFQLKISDEFGIPDNATDMFNFYRSWSMPAVHHIAISEAVIDCRPFSLKAIKSFERSGTMGTDDAQSLADLLVSMPNLHKLRLDVFGNPSHDSDPTALAGHYILPNVTDLKFETDSLLAFSVIFSHPNLQMPSLKKLCLNIEGDSESEDFTIKECLDEVPEHVYATVKELDISYSTSEQDHLDLCWLINICPGLETLSLDVPTILPLFSNELDANLPPLRSLSIQLTSTLKYFHLEQIIEAFKLGGIWEKFESFQFKGDRLLKKQRAEILTEGKMLWYD